MTTRGRNGRSPRRFTCPPRRCSAGSSGWRKPESYKRTLRVWQATEAGIRAARPGATTADVFAAQARVLTDAGIDVGNVGRFGHGLGKLITEPPSIAPENGTVLVSGMVLTIEPSAMFGDGRIMAHEENLMVMEDAPELLTARASREMMVID